MFICEICYKSRPLQFMDHSGDCIFCVRKDNSIIEEKVFETPINIESACRSVKIDDPEWEKVDVEGFEDDESNAFNEFLDNNTHRELEGFKPIRDFYEEEYIKADKHYINTFRGDKIVNVNPDNNKLSLRDYIERSYKEVFE